MARKEKNCKVPASLYISGMPDYKAIGNELKRRAETNGGLEHLLSEDGLLRLKIVEVLAEYERDYKGRNDIDAIVIAANYAKELLPRINRYLVDPKEHA